MRSVTQRVRKRSNTLRERRSHSQGSSIRSGQSKHSFATPIGDHVNGKESKASPVEEAPETSFEEDAPCADSLQDGLREKKAYLLSPFGTTSQVTLSMNELGTSRRVDPTIRLVGDRGRTRSRSTSGFSSEGSRRSFSSSEDLSDRGSANDSGRASPVSEVLSAYTMDRGEVIRMSSTELKTKERPSIEVDVRKVPGCRRQGDDEAGERQNSAQANEQASEEPEMSWTMIISLLTTVTVLVTIDAEWLVDSMDSLSPTLSKEWIGLILLPIVSSIAECVTAVNVSVKDQLSLSISVAVGSTIQTALFVIPFMVILGWILNKPLALLFDPFESVVLYISVHIMGCVVADGKSNWLEGVILICLYLVVAVTFWFYPGSNFSSTLAVCVDTVAPS